MTTPTRAVTARALVLLLPGCRETGPVASPTFPELDGAAASLFARLVLRGITREYPNKLDHVSSVHGHWMLVRLLKGFPDLMLGVPS